MFQGFKRVDLVGLGFVRLLLILAHEEALDDARGGVGNTLQDAMFS